MALIKTDHTSPPVTTLELARSPKYMGRLNRWDTPWFNVKLMTGITIIGAILLIGILGRLFWDTNLAYTASSPLNLPPIGFENSRGQVGTWEHPLGTENSGRDMLAVMMAFSSLPGCWGRKSACL